MGVTVAHCLSAELTHQGKHTRVWAQRIDFTASGLNMKDRPSKTEQHLHEDDYICNDRSGTSLAQRMLRSFDRHLL